MNSMRRAALRAAISASRTASNKPQVLGIATGFLAPASARIAVPAAVRCFSQTLRVAEDFQSDANESSRGPGSDIEPGFGLFIRNMVFEASEEHLRTAYEKYGTIEKVVIARDARGLSRGYGFVWFSKESERDAAVAGTDNSFWHGRRIAVTNRDRSAARAPGASRTAREPMPPSRSLYIGNIPYETTDAELNRVFKDLDNVKDVRVAVDRTTGWPRGFAHADFADIESATKGRDFLKTVTLAGRQLKVDFATESATLRSNESSNTKISDSNDFQSA